MASSTHFSDSDRKAIAAAVKEAETATAGEIVPVIVESSSSYAAADWKSIFFGMGTGLLLYEGYLLVFAGWVTGFWASVVGLPFFVIGGAIVARMMVHVFPTLKRLVISRSDMDAAVHDRAIKAFVDHEVFSTRDRTGIVILVSLFERRVEVFGDKGINAKVSSEDWSEVISDIISGIKTAMLHLD